VGTKKTTHNDPLKDDLPHKESKDGNPVKLNLDGVDYSDDYDDDLDSLEEGHEQLGDNNVSDEAMQQDITHDLELLLNEADSNTDERSKKIVGKFDRKIRILLNQQLNGALEQQRRLMRSGPAGGSS
jgi:hypothetical protein